jgi:phosphoesterase RecJ-like protein
MMNSQKTTATAPTDTAVLDALLAALREGQSFCLSGHQNPDGDVVGSQLAMASLIKRIDPKKQVDIINHGAVPKSVSFLPGADRIQNMQKVDGRYDVLIVFECSGSDRMGDIIDFSTQVGKVINIDHHLHNPNFGAINFVEPATSSTAELISKIFEHAKLPLTTDEASCIYAGMVADTGWFRYGNTNPQTHRIASRLLEAGVKVEDIAERQYMSKNKAALKLLGAVLTQMTLHYDDRVAVLKLPESLMKEVGAKSDDTDAIVNAGLEVDTVCASVLLKERSNPPGVKISLRSKGKYDINQVARLFGGGGHRNASGCLIEASLEQAEQAILKEMRRVF